MSWTADKPWTHPTIRAMSEAQLRARLAHYEAALADAEVEFADITEQQNDVDALLVSYQQSVLTFRKALEERL